MHTFVHTHIRRYTHTHTHGRHVLVVLEEVERKLREHGASFDDDNAFRGLNFTPEILPKYGDIDFSAVNVLPTSCPSCPGVQWIISPKLRPTRKRKAADSTGEEAGPSVTEQDLLETPGEVSL